MLYQNPLINKLDLNQYHHIICYLKRKNSFLNWNHSIFISLLSEISFSHSLGDSRRLEKLIFDKRKNVTKRWKWFGLFFGQASRDFGAQRKLSYRQLTEDKQLSLHSYTRRRSVAYPEYFSPAFIIYLHHVHRDRYRPYRQRINRDFSVVG